jgi:hypothetical protein
MPLCALVILFFFFFFNKKCKGFINNTPRVTKVQITGTQHNTKVPLHYPNHKLNQPLLLISLTNRSVPLR